MTSRTKAYIALTFAAFIWGAIIPLSKMALPHTTAHHLILFRYLLTLPVTLPLLFVYLKKYRPTVEKLSLITSIDTVGIINLMILYYALNLTTSIEASLLVNLRPIFVTIAGIALLKEIEDKKEWLGLSLATFGTFLLILTPVIGSAGPTFNLTGTGLILLTNVIDTFYVILIKKRYQGIPIPLLMIFHTVIASALLLSVSVITHTLPSLSELLQPQVLTAVMYAAVFGTLFGMALNLYGLRRIEASEAVIFQYLKPVVYIPLSLLWLGETVFPSQLIGLTVVLIGVYLVEVRTKPGFIQKLFRKTHPHQMHHPRI